MFVLVGLAGISFFYGGVVVGLSLVTAAKLAVTTKQHEEHDTKKKKKTRICAEALGLESGAF